MKILIFLWALLTVPVSLGSQTTEPFRLETVSSGLKNPWAVAVISREQFLVSSRKGFVYFLDRGKVYTIPADLPVEINGQGGLLDLILAQDFKKTGRIYVTFSRRHSQGAVTAAAEGIFDETSRTLRDWKIIFNGNNHGGGGWHFGSRVLADAKGTLYITIGDRRQADLAQDLTSHAGKTIRINTDGSIPPDNPFVQQKNSLPEIFSYGHRNSQGLAFHPVTGSLWQDEHGPRGGDELNRILPGRNYGWPVITYGKDYSGLPIGKGITAMEGMEQPQVYWIPSISPSGMAFYTGDEFPEWKHALFIGALSGRELRHVEFSGETITGQKSYLKDWKRIRDVRMGPDGSLYILTDGSEGGLYRIVRK